MKRKKPGQGMLANGRSKIHRQHIRLYHSIYASAQFKSLNPPARAVLFELLFIYNGYNNGYLAFPVRAGARLHISQATTSRAIKDLLAAGLVAISRPSGFSTKGRMATEYTLTFVEEQNGRVTFKPQVVPEGDVVHSFTTDADSFTTDARRG